MLAAECALRDKSGDAYSLDEIARFRADKGRDRHIRSCDPPLGHDRCVLERCLANQKLIRQHAETPQVNLFVVVIVLSSRLDHLRWQIVQGTTHGLSPAVGSVHTPAEVRDLDLVVYTDENVLRLDVAMNDVLAVEVPKSRGHLCDVTGSFPFWESVLSAKVLIQLTLGSELKNQEDTLAIVEVTVHLKNVGVTKVALDLDLTTNLFLDVVVLQLVLVQDLQAADETARTFTSEVNTAKLSLAERTTDLEHAQVELFWDGRLVSGQTDSLVLLDGLLGLARGA